MKIETRSGRTLRMPSARPGDAVERVTAREDPFMMKLAQEEERKAREVWERLLADVESRGRVFVDHPSVATCAAYRDAMRALVRHGVSNALRLRTQIIHDTRGRQQVHAVVEQIDQALVELMEKALGQNLTRIEILTRVDELRGLVISLAL
ncbi:YaaR family protein [Ferroacidibacillus organovorans]|uniref:DUF327 domain-containing protein n=1 Tax=Ferroacidibacillus organovorans TaxID=1765683 RepID=A0A101XS91_9BACL|nr:YaaR family protein [Ferroacidibacillus organovorans]KUO96581.1 hypothetical protein ATW55_00410 [Ferroacidibacillus organovorans]